MEKRVKNILLVTQYFYPENFKSNDIAFELQKRGYNVTVLTGIPNYPEGKFYKGFGVFKKRKQTINNVKVIRSLLVPRGNGKGIRLPLNYFSWAFFASIRAFFLSFIYKFDAIIVHEPSPITQGFPAIVVKKIQKIPIYFWVLDLWPESLTSAAGVTNKNILGFFTSIVKFIYKNSDKVLISSKGFAESICEKGNFSDKLIYFPNWAENTISSGDINKQIPKLPEGFLVLFAGNIGAAQDMESIMQAALLLRSNQEIKILILGDGREKNYVQDFIANNQLEATVHLLGKYPIEYMSAFFNSANALLVTLKDEKIFNITVPAKVQAYMSSKKPIIAMMNGEGAQLIEFAKCGLSGSAGNYEALAANILKMSRLSNEEKIEMGINGYNYFQNNFTLSSCMDNLELILNNE